MLIELEKANKFIDWLKNMLFLNAKVKTAGKRVVFRGQVYFCELGEGIGSEESKNRPCIILQNDLGNKNSNNTIVAPITNGGAIPTVCVTIPNNTYSYTDNSGNTTFLSGNILLSNIVTVSKARLGDFICNLSDDDALMKEINEKLISSVGLYRTFKKLNDTITSDKKAITRLIETRNKLTKENEDLINQIEKLKNNLPKEEK